MTSTERILTITLNPALDKTINLPLLAPGEVNRAQSIRVDPGGKGINVSRALALWGGDTLAAGLLGKENSRLLINRLEKLSIPTSFVEVDGETRTNLKMVETESNRVTDLNEPGFTVSDQDLKHLKRQYVEWLEQASWVILSGSLPPGTPTDWYRDLIQEARSRDKQVVLDSSGEALRKGIEAAPTVVKPNREELEDFLGRPIQGDEDLLKAARAWLYQGVEWVVVSLGADGAWFVTMDGIYRTYPPRVSEAHPVGAGDAMVAGLVWGLYHEMPPANIARWATASGVHAASKPGTQFGNHAEVNRWMEQVTLKRWD
ncbi:1-phosphofructokinase [Desmospora activa]|uniref:Tagatose-6-phosphate kinase n=1 Tax=Desmospora activa DSM 45169 TaxID=1121389 RepID=A0A2T4Z6Q7_9BACL|nr:1-phosphofructokinase [Desmospora activa]PTM57567.1 fructose-1-phosphate kinase [Desmospora activa DSM 45169]